jgi:hypothetical protein
MQSLTNRVGLTNEAILVGRVTGRGKIAVLVFLLHDAVI